MNVYDPTKRIVYVHLASEVVRHGTPLRTEDPTPDRLPDGYANQSPRTRVRRDTDQPRSGIRLA